MKKINRASRTAGTIPKILTCIHLKPQKEGRLIGTKKALEKMMVRIFPTLLKDTYLQIQELQ